MTAQAAVPVRARPRARGWIHLYSAVIATVMSLALIPLAAVFVGPGAAFACSIYAVTLVGMFTVSATYHRHTWRSVRARTWMRRVDHSMIFLFIAGTYTPMTVLALHPPTSTVVLTTVWIGRGGRGGAEDVLAARTRLGGRSVLPRAGLGGRVRTARPAGQRWRGGPVHCWWSAVLLYSLGAFLLRDPAAEHLADHLRIPRVLPRLRLAGRVVPLRGDLAGAVPGQLTSSDSRRPAAARGPVV